MPYKCVGQRRIKIFSLYPQRLYVACYNWKQWLEISKPNLLWENVEVEVLVTWKQALQNPSLWTLCENGSSLFLVQNVSPSSMLCTIPIFIFISFQKPRLSFSEILTAVPFIVQKFKDFNVTGTNCSFLSSKANDIVYWRLLSGRRKLKILKCFSRVILPVELQSIIVTKCSKVLWFSSVRSNQVI